ncbi:bucentaur or craniofacial development-domain-containing protein [Suillus bovinus]|uniref:bucentaur or craniofacial development-domain-containing protein n=1 Tax=Suillus bovinus TaxID=48563 RepID=UPI001B8830A9|nr:bucentaur or craniofacial development-domain-containing protein [Suillus bovinus]KAG2137432.1 bucentaur or craniofacial development-domain-containing protein [Suillus bovinus]
MSPPLRDPTSDSEDDDPDYAPPSHQDSDSDSSGDEDGNADANVPNEVKEEDLVEKKKARDALWVSFQASVATPPLAKVVEEPPKKLVKIEKRYLFAGKNIVEVVEVAEDSEEAKKWPRWDPSEPSSAAAPALDSSSSTTDANATALSSEAPVQFTAQKSTTRKPPGPRKPRTSLADIPTQKAKKITTLDKSAMDWRTHVTSSDAKDELDANRRGGGYLEKMDFLKRVQDRREDAYEASKSNKRRRT